jgi:Tfp pilus assembly protein PilN
MNMKTILMVVLVLLALVGILSIVLYVVNHNVSVQVKGISFLPQESIKDEVVAKFTPLTHGESNSLALIENKSLLSLTAGAFNPQFELLSSFEQKALKTSEEQKPELQNMTAGDLDRNAGLGNVTWGGVLLAFLLIVILF